MADRVYTWHALEAFGNKYNLGAFYIDADFEPLAVRIKAEEAPTAEDAEFNIYVDGVTIFADTGTILTDSTSGAVTSTTVDTNVSLSKGETEEFLAGDFKPEIAIEQGSWLTCNIIKDGGGKNFSIALLLERISDEDAVE